MNRYLRFAPAAAAGVLWWALPYLFPGRLSVFITIALFAPIVIGLSMLTGYTGQASLGQAAFYGLGAYCNGALTVHLDMNPWLAAVLAIAFTGAVAYVVGAPVLLLRGHYLVIATLGFNIIVEVLMRQLRGVTGGPSGLIGIPSLSVGAYVGDVFYYYAAGAVTIAAMILSHNLIRSRFGRALQAIETSETAAASLAIRSAHHKNLVFVWSAVLAGASGVLYSGWLSFVSPSTFGLGFSVVLLTMAVVGGIASIPGAVLGTALLELLREELKNAPRWLGGGSPESEIVVFGLLLVLMVMFAPQGLWPRLAGLVARRRRSVPASLTAPAELEFSPVENGGPSLLEVRALTRRFGGLTAVSGAGFTVEAGEILAVIGPNGAGKTTLLNLISGVLTPSEGQIAVAGTEVAGAPAHRIAALGVARSFQTPRTFSLLNVLDNVKVGEHRHTRAGFVRSALNLAGREERSTEAQAIGALEMAGIAELAHRPVASLPFGAQRLVELARALASKPRLLLLDEPASGLTASERDALVNLIRAVRDKGVTVILVEHNVRLVMELADRVLVLHHGEVLKEGTPAEVSNDPEVIAAYLGESHADEAAQRKPRVVATGEGAPLLSVASLNAGYGAIHVLHDVTIDVARGEAVAVLGRNGAGKSTLMKAVTGLIGSRGTIELDGKPIRGHSPEAITRAGLSLVPERRQLLETMTVEDHLVLGAYVRRGRSDAGEIGADIARTYELFPILREKRNDIGRSLSGGQQQMLAIARALMARPRVLLLDEPLLGLAPKIVEDIAATIERLRDEGIGVVVVEQNVSAVLPIVDRAYVLENGHIVLADRAEVLIGSRALEAAFLGTDLQQQTETTEAASVANEQGGPRAQETRG